MTCACSLVTTGLVPVIPTMGGAAIETIGMAGASPARTGEGIVR
jgi:hypothetical protein